MTGIRTAYHYNVDDIIGNIVIIDKITINKKESKSKSGFVLSKGYRYKCNVCGYIGDKSESDIKKGIGCSVCNGKVVKKNINSIWKTHNYMCSVIDREDDCFNNTYCSSKIVNTKCPDCGEIRPMRVRDLYNDGYSCRRCGDNVSIPSKFISEVIRRSGVKFEQEKIFSWSLGRVYDIYLEDFNTIIEVNGKQHYDGGFNRIGGKSLDDEKRNDELKEGLAKENRIDNYIVLDCRKSSFDWLKTSIYANIFMKKIVNDNIDMQDCYKVACSSKVKLVKELWDSGIKISSEISKIMNISQQSAISYLKKCRDIGWCDYDENVSSINGRERGHKRMMRKVVCLDNLVVKGSIKDMIEYFRDVDNITLTNSGISSNCSGRYSNHKGYRFMYYEEYLKQNN